MVGNMNIASLKVGESAKMQDSLKASSSVAVDSAKYASCLKQD